MSDQQSRWAPTVYFVIGQAGWFACVLGAARGMAWIGTLFAAALVATHVARARRPREELKLLASVVVMGGVWESALVYFDVLAYPHGSLVGGLAPAWILALWGLFAAQFNTTYQWLKPRILAAAVLGAIAGPLSFRGGAALGAVRFVKLWPALVTLGVGWAVLLPLVTLFARRWDGVGPRQGDVRAVI